MLFLALFIILVAISVAFRVYAILPKPTDKRKPQRRKVDTYSVAVFLGSGMLFSLHQVKQPERPNHRSMQEATPPRR